VAATLRNTLRHASQRDVAKDVLEAAIAEVDAIAG